MKVAAYPHQKAQDRKRTYDFFYNKAYPDKTSIKALKVEDFMNVMKSKGLYG